MPTSTRRPSSTTTTTYSFFYRQAPQTLPADYDPVAEATQVLLEHNQSLPASNPEVPSLWQQIRGVTIESALSTPMRALGTIGLAAGTFDVGWKIGSGIDAKFLKIGVPEPPPAPPGPITYRLRFITSEGKWLFENNYGRNNWYPGFFQQRHSDCDPYGVQGAPAGMDEVSVGPLTNCSIGGPTITSDVVQYWMPENSLAQPAAIEDYSNQPFDYQSASPVAPTQADAEAQIDQALDKPQYAELRQWLNYQLGSPGETDPLGIGPPNPVWITVPDCAGATFSACSQQLRDAGFTGTITREYASFDDADLTKPAGAVLGTQPAAGSQVHDDGEVVVTTNPDDPDMPRVVPAPQARPGEAASDYASRLGDLGLTDVQISETANPDWDFDPTTAVAVHPAPGTRVHTSDEISVESNPSYGGSEEDHLCDRSTPLGSDPDPSRGTEPGDPRQYDVFRPAELLAPLAPGFGLPFASHDSKTAELRWGRAKWVASKGWMGWGYRKIAAKHGWAPVDAAETQAAMSRPPAAEYEDPATHDVASREYRGLPYQQNGVTCERVVIVAYLRSPAEAADDPPNPEKGIVTSYGETVG